MTFKIPFRLPVININCSYTSKGTFQSSRAKRIVFSFTEKLPDPCETVGCKAPYNIGCQTVNNTAECICPTCPDTTDPVCTSDDIQDRSACHMRRQSCISGDLVTIAKSGPCGTYYYIYSRYNTICLRKSIAAHGIMKQTALLTPHSGVQKPNPVIP